MNGIIEREYIRFQKISDGQLIEHRFRSTMNWPSTGKFYALASDPESIEQCKRMALKTPEERAAVKAAADAHHERYRVKQTEMPVLHVEEPAHQHRHRFGGSRSRRPDDVQILPAPRRNP
ncbi:hypothetical protein E0J16_00050 [Rhizobium pisi]|uniref:hypothetical protein n=1 Tax=Rhizobium pisi TaxID=574561 RepID=UPI00103F67ED|nr:hypothetical protein [Rhizobium pisi]TCA62714.1 hypothetical protein E0J16_00050 [Rhizobium pisi]